MVHEIKKNWLRYCQLFWRKVKFTLIKMQTKKPYLANDCFGFYRLNAQNNDIHIILFLFYMFISFCKCFLKTNCLVGIPFIFLLFSFFCICLKKCSSMFFFSPFHTCMFNECVSVFIYSTDNYKILKCV